MSVRFLCCARANAVSSTLIDSSRIGKSHIKGYFSVCAQKYSATLVSAVFGKVLEL